MAIPVRLDNEVRARLGGTNTRRSELAELLLWQLRHSRNVPSIRCPVLRLLQYGALS